MNIQAWAEIETGDEVAHPPPVRQHKQMENFLLHNSISAENLHAKAKIYFPGDFYKYNNQEGGSATYMHVAGGFSVSMCVNAIHYDAIVF